LPAYALNAISIQSLHPAQDILFAAFQLRNSIESRIVWRSLIASDDILDLANPMSSVNLSTDSNSQAELFAFA
jgi:hypothetical protein